MKNKQKLMVDKLKKEYEQYRLRENSFVYVAPSKIHKFGLFAKTKFLFDLKIL